MRKLIVRSIDYTSPIPDEVIEEAQRRGACKRAYTALKTTPMTLNVLAEERPHWHFWALVHFPEVNVGLHLEEDLRMRVYIARSSGDINDTGLSGRQKAMLMAHRTDYPIRWRGLHPRDARRIRYIRPNLTKLQYIRLTIKMWFKI